MNLAVEMPVRSLSTESPEQNANVNEYYGYCLERTKTREHTISILPADDAGHDNVSVDRVACRAFNKPQSC